MRSRLLTQFVNSVMGAPPVRSMPPVAPPSMLEQRRQTAKSSVKSSDTKTHSRWRGK